MKKKLLNLLLLISFQFGYLQWGKDQSLFIFQAEAALFAKAFTEPAGLLHPFILVPLAGLLILLYTLFQKEPGRKLTIAGLVCLSLLMLFIFLIGILSLKLKILFSAIPFLMMAFLIIWNKSYIKEKSPAKMGKIL